MWCGPVHGERFPVPVHPLRSMVQLSAPFSSTSLTVFFCLSAGTVSLFLASSSRLHASFCSTGVALSFRADLGCARARDLHECRQSFLIFDRDPRFFPGVPFSRVDFVFFPASDGLPK